jgi:hypothetical protein
MTTVQDIADTINAHALALFQAGKTIKVTGEESTYHFRAAKGGFAGGLQITYGGKRVVDLKPGPYGASISIAAAGRLARALAAKRSSFSCTDEDGEPLTVSIS